MRWELIARRYLPRTIDSHAPRIEKRSIRHEHRICRGPGRPHPRTPFRSAKRSPLSLRHGARAESHTRRRRGPGAKERPEPLRTVGEQDRSDERRASRMLHFAGRARCQQRLAPSEGLRTSSAPLQTEEHLVGSAPFWPFGATRNRQRLAPDGAPNAPGGGYNTCFT